MNTPETRPDESDTQREPPMAAALRKWGSRGLWLFVASLALAIVYPRFSVRARSSYGCNTSIGNCLANLYRIQGAKETWALEERRRPQDIPSVADLIGPASYIARAPVCGSGGIYTYGRVDQKPTCSYPGHSLK